MIILSITGPAMTAALRQIRLHWRHADLLELRLDLLRSPRIGPLIASSPLPVIATCRPRREGGAFAGSERERIEMLEAASMLGARYVDIELAAGRRVIGAFLSRREDTQVIVSAHRRVTDVAAVDRLYDRLHATGADVIKLAFPATDAADLGLVMRFLSRARSDRRRAVCIATGEAGEASRVLYKKLGGWGTYACPEADGAAAPGQLSAGELRSLYRAHALNSRTRVYGVVGYPLAQSRGVYIHNPLFHRAGCNAVYCRFPVKNLRLFMGRVAPLLAGFSVTVPHKERILPCLQSVDRAAGEIGAANTVLRFPAGWRGTNTDAPGALDAIERVLPVAGRRVLLIGAGGAARAIAWEARRRGASVLVANRTEARARRLALELGLTFVPLRALSGCAFDVLVNATSVGMVPHADRSPVDRSLLRNGVVFDAVYNPRMTRLLRDAGRAGATIVPGTEMYVHQAAGQSALYTGVRPSLRTVRSLLDRSLGP